MRRRLLMRFVGVSIALLLTLITPALAQSAKQQPVFIFGEGLASCGEFLQTAETERKTRPPSATATKIYDSEYAALVMYADGFLTGANLWDVQNSSIGIPRMRSAGWHGLKTIAGHTHERSFLT